MKIIQLLGLFLATSFLHIHAQSSGTPNWAQESIRNAQFPDAQYLKGYFYAENNTNESSGDFLGKQVEAARAQLIGSIYSKVTSKTELDIENQSGNGEVTTDELFRLRSATVSNANISGLQTKKQYDATTRMAYAFVYAKRSDVISYNKTLLNQNKQILEGKIQQAQQYLQSGDNQLALKTYYECMTFFREVETAQSVLVALTNSYNFPNRSYFSDARVTVDKGIATIQKSDQLTLDDVCLFMAKGLHVQAEDVREYIQLLPFTYEDKGFPSAFADQFRARFESQLTKEARYRVGIAKPAFSAEQAMQITGSYWLEKNIIKIIANLKDNKNRTIASVEGQLPISWTKNNGVEIIPVMLNKIDQLSDFVLTPITQKIRTKINKLDKDAAKVKVVQESSGEAKNNIPLIFEWIPKNKVISKSSSNRNGIAIGPLQGLPASNIPHRVRARIDIPRYLGLDPASVEYQRLAPTLPNAAKTDFTILVSGLVAYIEGAELDHTGNALAVPVLAPKIKNFLTKEGYSFTDDSLEADIIISLNANIEEIKNPGALNFAYLSCEISVVSMETTDQIYGNTFERIKGGGGSPAQATTNAYKDAAEKIADGLRSALQN